MKKAKLPALILTLALLFTQFAILGTVPASATGTTIDDAPAYPDYALTELSKTGKKISWGAQYNYTADNVYTATTGGSVDMSAAEQIEFDIYIADYAAFASAVSGKALRFYVASGSGRYNNRRAYDFDTQITASGWNHIILGRNDHYSSDSTDFTAIKWVGLAFWNGSGVSNPIGSTQVRIANVCASMKEINRLPDAPDYAYMVASREGKTKSWGDNYNYTNDRVYIDLSAAPVDMDAAELIEFDIYIKDYAAFASAVDGYALRFYVASGGNQNNNRRVYDFVTQITGDGWNHIILDRNTYYSTNSCSFSAIKYIGLAFWNGNGVANPIASTEVRIANVCAALKVINRVPDYPANAVVEIHRDGRTYEGVTQYHYLADKTRNVSNINISSVDQIEFDLYIGDLTAFRNQISGHSLYFVLKTSGDSSHRARYQFTLQVVNSGWNHIILQKDAKDDIGETPNFSNVTAYYFAFWNDSSGSPVNNPNASTVFRIANLCGTNVPDYPTYAHTEMYKLSASNYWGATANNSNFLIGGLTPTDISATDRVEFDVFVQNYENFASATLGGEIRFRFGDANDNYIDLNVKNKITHGGWNHVSAVWLSSSEDPNTDRYTITGNNLDLTAIKWIKFYSTVGINWETVGKTRFANVCFTNKPIYRTRSLVLAERIGVNYYMDLRALTAAEKEASYMTFDVTKSDEELSDYYNSTDVNDNGYYCFTCQLSSMQMAETITPTFHYGDGRTLTGGTYSVKDYIDYVVANSEAFNAANPYLVPLVKSLGDYGHYMQGYLGNKNSWTAGEHYTALAKYRAADYTTDDFSSYVTSLNNRGAAMVKNIEGSAVTRVQYNLNFDSTTYINVLLTANEAITASAIVGDRTIRAGSNGAFRTQGLPILELGNAFTLSGTGSTNANGFSVTLSGLSYVRSVLNSSGTSTLAKNAMASLFDYYTAACHYHDMITYGRIYDYSLDGEEANE